MNLFEILKQFKKVEPDPRFTDRSRRMILAVPQEETRGIRRGLPAVWGILEAGVAVVLAGFFIVLITGSFPGSSYLAPVQFSVIDPQGLHAEAQAIDMQIQLANLNYPEASTPAATTKMSPKPTIKNAAPIGASSVSPFAASTTPSTTDTTSTTSSTVSLDQALEQLSQ